MGLKNSCCNKDDKNNMSVSDDEDPNLYTKEFI